MLSTLLENKVKGGKWHALIDKVYAPLNLYTAARKVTGKKKAAGVDGQSCETFEESLFVETRQLSAEIKAQTYRPSAVLRVHIPKPGRPNETRPLGIPTVTGKRTPVQSAFGLGRNRSSVSSASKTAFRVAQIPDGFGRGVCDPEGLAFGNFFGPQRLDFDPRQRSVPRRGRAANDPAAGMLA